LRRTRTPNFDIVAEKSPFEDQNVVGSDRFVLERPG
jgi:hypothetical protein